MTHVCCFISSSQITPSESIASSATHSLCCLLHSFWWRQLFFVFLLCSPPVCIATCSRFPFHEINELELRIINLRRNCDILLVSSIIQWNSVLLTNRMEKGSRIIRTGCIHSSLIFPRSFIVCIIPNEKFSTLQFIDFPVLSVVGYWHERLWQLFSLISIMPVNLLLYDIWLDDADDEKDDRCTMKMTMFLWITI